jgi:DNA-binding NarL/FixJ family response regulator
MTAVTPIRLVIADDHEIFRDGLALMLSRQKNMTLAGQASDGNELVAAVKETMPDVVLADIKMPNMDGIEATKVLLKEFPDLRIIALSMFSEENLIVEMLEAGAKGYLLKNADKQEILDAIASVMENRVYYCRDTSATLAGMIIKSNFNPYRKREVVEFSDREMEIIKLICRQFTAQEMGENLFLSRRTVEGYRTRILEKMNVKNTAGVVIYALKNKLISEKELL